MSGTQKGKVEGPPSERHGRITGPRLESSRGCSTDTPDGTTSASRIVVPLLAITLMVPVLAAVSMARRSTVQVGPANSAITISLADWGLDSVDKIRLGQLSLIHDENGDRLEVYALRETLPPEESDRFHGETPPHSGSVLVVGDFTSNQNALGGYFSEFQRPPSRAEVTLARTPDDLRALKFSYDRERQGYCGFWIHLFDFSQRPENRRYLDARPFSALSFWIRGSDGGERLLLKLADAEWERREDALPLGEVSDFLPGGRVENRWQQAVVSLNAVPLRVRASLLASMVFEVMEPGAGEVYLGPVAFMRRPDDELPLSEPASDSTRELATWSKATWIWNTEDLLDEETLRDELLRFLSEERFDRVFLQLPQPTEGWSLADEAEEGAPLSDLVAALNGVGMKVYALDGSKEHALPAYHGSVLSTIEDVIRYNAEAPADARFFGIRHDIEPYLLPGFNGNRRDEILTGFLDLVAASARKAGGAGLAYGVDLPFWYDVPDEYAHEPIEIDLEGERKPVSHAVIDLADDVSIMAYRTNAYGADGTIRHATGELAYATRRGKQVFIGLETSALPDEELFEFAGEPRRALPDRLLDEALVIIEPRGDSARISLRRRGVKSRGRGSSGQPSPWHAPEGLDEDSVLWWMVSRRVDVPGDKLSFARLGPDRIRRVMGETALELERFESFVGFALHHVWSYRRLLEQDRD